MYQVNQTNYFSKWLHKLKDIKGKIAIARRIERVQNDNLEDYKYLDSNIYELRITVGPGYRIYFSKSSEKIILLLIGGDKST